MDVLNFIIDIPPHGHLLADQVTLRQTSPLQKVWTSSIKRLIAQSPSSSNQSMVRLPQSAQTLGFDGFDKAFRTAIQIRTAGMKLYGYNTGTPWCLMESCCFIQRISIMDEIPFLIPTPIFAVRKNSRHLPHIFPIRL